MSEAGEEVGPEPPQRFRFETNPNLLRPDRPSTLEPAPTSEESTGDSLSIADGIERRVAPDSIRADRISGWIALLVLSGGGAVATGLLVALSGWPLPIRLALMGVWAFLTAAGLWLAHGWPALQWRRTSFRVDAGGIEIRKGVLWRRVINVSRSRIQHTDVSQGPLQRRFELATLIIHTAGTEHATVDLAGLSHATALKIRDHLISGEGDDAV